MGIWKTVLPIILAVVIAVFGGIFTYNMLKQQMTPKGPVAEQEVVQIAVAGIDLPWGSELAAEQLKLVPFLKQTAPPGSFNAMEKLSRRVVIYPIKKDEPILESKLAPVDVKTGGISAVVNTGKRAVAVKGDKVIGLSGLIRPGNRVDVLVSIEDPRDKKRVTKLVLENVLVLATGPDIEKKEKPDPASVEVFTLEVTPEEAEKLALASNEGRLQLALRNSVDTETVLTKGATIAETLDSYKKTVKVVEAEKMTRVDISGPMVVHEIRGSKESKIEF